MPEPHSLNDGFTWSDHRGPFRVVTDEPSGEEPSILRVCQNPIR